MKNLTDKVVTTYDEDDHFDPETCPVCGSDDTSKLGLDDEGDIIIEGMACNKCGSEFSHTFWIHCTFVRQDGRFQA